MKLWLYLSLMICAPVISVRFQLMEASGVFVKIDLSIVGDRLAPSIIVAIGCLWAAGYRSGTDIHRRPLLATNLDIIVAVDGGFGVGMSLEFDRVSGGWSIVVDVDECAILVYFHYLCVGAHCGYDAEEEE